MLPAKQEREREREIDSGPPEARGGSPARERSRRSRRISTAGERRTGGEGERGSAVFERYSC